MHKQTMPDGISAGQTVGQQVNTQHKFGAQEATQPKRLAAPVAQRKLEFDFSNHTENPMENSTGNIESTQIDTTTSTLRDSMLCSATISEHQIAIKIKPHNLTHNTCYLTSNTIRVAQQY
jgi:hypothetical protein